MSYLGAGAQMVGGIMQSIAASQAAKAMQEQYKQELMRQRRYGQQSSAEFIPSLTSHGAETAQTQMAQGQQERMKSYSDMNNGSFAIGTAPIGAADKSYLNLTGASRAKLGSYGDWQLEQAINNIRTNEALNRVSNFAGGAAQVFPYRMYDAQHSADELAFWGGLISSIGGGGGSMASSFGGKDLPMMQNQQLMNQNGMTWGNAPIGNLGAGGGGWGGETQSLGPLIQ